MIQKRIISLVILVLIIIGILLSLRFILGGSEDTWLCQAGTWVKHGNPSSPQPNSNCE